MIAVELIDVRSLDVYKWLRKEEGLSISYAKYRSKNGQKIIFDSYQKAIAFFDYLHNCGQNSARLTIDVIYDTRGAVKSYAGYVSQADIDLAKEFESNEER